MNSHTAPDTSSPRLQRATVRRLLGDLASISTATQWGETHPALVDAWNALHDAETALTGAVVARSAVMAGSSEDLASRNID